jgi:prephenate dehydrogenase
VRVAIIGAAGKMGTWFCGYFARKGHEVGAFDLKPFQISGVETATSVADCVRNADLVVVCVPVKQTPVVLRQCASRSLMKPGALLAEISSVKAKTLPVLRNLRDDLVTLCVHPMFGPGASEKKPLKMLVIPVRNRELELHAISQVFVDMSTKVLPDAETHDKAIASVLGLTYFANLSFANMLAQGDLATLREVAGTTFAIQSMLAQSVMTDEPELIVALIKDNPHARRYIRQYLKQATELASSSEELLKLRLKKVRTRLQKQTDIEASYKLMYEMIEILGRRPS